MRQMACFVALALLAVGFFASMPIASAENDSPHHYVVKVSDGLYKAVIPERDAWRWFDVETELGVLANQYIITCTQERVAPDGRQLVYFYVQEKPIHVWRLHVMEGRKLNAFVVGGMGNRPICELDIRMDGLDADFSVRVSRDDVFVLEAAASEGRMVPGAGTGNMDWARDYSWTSVHTNPSAAFKDAIDAARVNARPSAPH